MRKLAPSAFAVSTFERLERSKELLCDSCDAALVQAEDNARALEQARLNRESRIVLAALPRLFRGIEWADVEVDDGNRAAVDAAKRWGRGELHGLTLVGDIGAGKTFLAAAAARQLLGTMAVRWYSVPTLIAQSYQFGEKEQRDLSRVLTGWLPIVLDDLDKVKPTQWVATQLFTAIDSRYSNGGAVLATTNLAPDEFADRFGPALADRLFGGDWEVHEVTGQSRRTR